MLLLLDNKPHTTVVGITDRLDGLIAQIEATQPDVLVLEWEIPISPMADLVSGIRKLDQPIEIIVLSSDWESQEQILAVGVDHVIMKNAPPDELITILENPQIAATKNKPSNR